MGGLLTSLLCLPASIYHFTNKGFSYVSSYLYFVLVQWFKKSRFDIYDYSAVDKPTKNSFFIPDVEWELESPQRNIPQHDESADDVFCFGVNSKSEVLAIYISRFADGKVNCSMLLQLSNGRIFSLPEEHVTQQSTGEDYTFGSSRLKFQCILPMRKWRVYFNGLLQDHSKGVDSSISKYHHVRLTFLWTASSDVFDFSSDMGKSLLAHNVSKSSEWNHHPKHFLQWVQNTFNSYEHPGMLLGTVKIDDDQEEEMYLWGTRGHYTGQTQGFKESNFFEVYANFRYGEVLHLGRLNSKGNHFLYGYLMRSDGFIYPFEELTELGTDETGTRFTFFSGNIEHQLTIKGNLSQGLLFQKEFGGKSTANYSEMTLDGMPGRGLIIKGITEGNIQSVIQQSAFIKKPHLLTVSFSDEECHSPSLTGGKGSSLGKLYSISREKIDSGLSSTPWFTVPNGFVVTTDAYEEFIRGGLCNQVREFEKAVWSSKDHSFKGLCDNLIQEIHNTILPTSIVQSIKDQLKELMVGEDYKFAVRSSATGEDTEQMSAAGQMETFLGLKSTEEILTALKKCWASQFTFQAVEYKRQYGQLLNSPMAVVVQKMVACEVAGVAFTCDPLTGNPSFINITGNWGLGESVVSAAAEPDTVVLNRDITNKVTFHSQQIGKKESKIVMKGDSGTEEVPIDNKESGSCCLSSEMAIRLGQIAVLIEEKFGSTRDLEWGILVNEIFLFQSRPVTSLDIYTGFETKHFSDVFLRTEEEYLTTGNVGEVMPGATSILGMDFFSTMMDFSLTRTFYNKEDQDTVPDVPYYYKKIVFYQNHAFFVMADTLQRFKQGDSNLAKGMSIAILGRIFLSKQLNEMAEQRHDVYGKTHAPNPILTTIKLTVLFVITAIKKLFDKELENFELSISDQKSPREMLYDIGLNIPLYGRALKVHIGYTISSSIWNMFLLSTLAKAEGDWNSNVYSDFAYLLSGCSDVESADVPQAIQRLARVITQCIDPKNFAKMSEGEALKWLQSSHTKAGELFHQFLSRHGHRCLKEFDVFSETWGTNPKPLLKILQDLVTTDLKELAEKENPSFYTILSKLQVKPSFMQRLSLRWIVPRCHIGVRGREASKSVCIKVLHQFRLAINRVSERMVQEGYVPNKDLVFFLCMGEILELLRTRSPRIIARAIKRQKALNKLDKLIFSEITVGIPEPINGTQQIDASAKGFSMTGVPVSQGVVKATARVVTNLEDAFAIQPGDILIAHSTDIGWSPYFPLLSGVVTELGGLISHGAVVAREYGLPCVVGLHGATRAFKSGDLVLLDGNKGILQRVDAD